MKNKLEAYIDSLPKRTVETEYGPVTGYIAGGAANFKGIPYAAPACRPPAVEASGAAGPLDGPLNATSIGCVCPQDRSFSPSSARWGRTAFR